MECLVPANPRLSRSHISGQTISSMLTASLLCSLSLVVLSMSDCFIFLDISLVARFFYREANRLSLTEPDRLPAEMARSHADTLLKALEEKAGKWHPFGLYLGQDVRKAEQGLVQRPGMYSRT
jgi:hypothetical protein